MIDKICKWFSKCKSSLKSIRPRLEKADKEIHEYLDEYLKENPEWINKQNVVMHLVYGKELVRCLVCNKVLNPGKNTKYCSVKCAQNSKNVRDKIENTCLLHYGVKYPSKSKEIQEKIQKNNLIKYGVESPLKTKEIQEKIRQTNLKKYGGVAPICNNEIKEKIQNTNLKKYGVKCTRSSNKVIDKIKITKLEKYGTLFNATPESIKKMSKTLLLRGFEIYKKEWNKYQIIPLFNANDWEGGHHNLNGKKYMWKCCKCGNIFEQAIILNSHIDKKAKLVPRCLNCYPINYSTSNIEHEIANFIQSLGFQIKQHDRTLITPLELDIVIPEKKIAIEFNGDYWHSTKVHVDKNYHLNKTELVEAKNYQLIHIFEHEWINKKHLIEEKLKGILGINQNRIGARQCIIKEISSKEKDDFLNKYHIQGEDKSKVKLGLYFNNELVSLMTFGKPRFNSRYTWELIRFATKEGVQVYGGASKLLHYFRKNYNGSIITYADRRWSKGNLYHKLDFKLIGKSTPNYVWSNLTQIYSRYSCMKHNLKNILGNKFDENLTEKENMVNNGFYQIYDCGNLVFELN